MWFKNLLAYRLPPDWNIDSAALEAALARMPLQRCGSFEMETRGWVAPRERGPLVHVLNRQCLIALGVEQKLLPASVVKQVAKDRAAEIETQQPYPVGRKQMRDIRDQVLEELLPKAFTRRRTTRAWIDPMAGWLVVDAASEGKADDLLSALRTVLDDVQFRRLETERSPSAAMTQWLAAEEAPTSFSIDQDLELRAADESKATVRYVRHNLEGQEIHRHIRAGKAATRLGMTWNDRISFVLTEQLQVKRVAFVDIAKDATEDQTEDAEERFDVDFALMTGELAQMLAALTEALGGEKGAASAPAPARGHVEPGRARERQPA